MGYLDFLGRVVRRLVWLRRSVHSAFSHVVLHPRHLLLLTSLFFVCFLVLAIWLLIFAPNRRLAIELVVAWKLDRWMLRVDR